VVYVRVVEWRKHIVAALLLSGCGLSVSGVPIALPDGAPGIGFDDLRFSPTLHRVLAPAGRTGNLALVEPNTLAVTTAGGFSKGREYDGGHDFGATSVDEGRGLLFVTDRTSKRLDVIDPETRAIVGFAALAGAPDYVRFVAMNDEVWVTEPDASRIEVFALPPGRAPSPVHKAQILVSNGPESLVIDQTHGRAYTHRWQSSSLAIDVRTHAVVAEWPNGCDASRGLALDEARGFFFAGCADGKVSVLDVNHGGQVLSQIAHGSGFDVMGYNPTLGHLYLAGSKCACVVMLGVSRAGKLSLLGRLGGPKSTHCATADDARHAWICDQEAGRLWRIDDRFKPSW
jgi:hypothetical protein